jgi:MSHA biogenesis protein MshQ
MNIENTLLYICRKKLFANTLLVLLNISLLLLSSTAQSTIVYTGQASSANNALPTNGSPGTITINKPTGTVTGQALIATLSARPRNTTVTVPSGWILMTRSEQTSGGSGTAPGGMTLLTYYRIVSAGDPTSYSWTFANPSNTGGSVVGGILAFSGIDTSSGSPINVWSQKLNASGSTHSTDSITPTKPNTMLISSITYLSGSSFANPTGVSGITERIDQRAPSAQSASGTTLQMSTTPWVTTTATGSVQANIEGGSSYNDAGIGHIMALESSEIDPAISITLNSSIIAGGTGSYTLSIVNNGSISEPGPIIVTNTLPSGLIYNTTSSGGTGWVCSAAGQVITCTRSGSLAADTSATPITINFNVGASASGSITNTATITGTGGDGNTANNTDTDTTTISIPVYTNIATYHFDETTWSGASGEIFDSSGNGYHATAAYRSGSSYPSTASSNQAISGMTGTCGYGVFTNNQYVSLPTGFPNLTGSFTITAWFNTSDATRLNQRIFSDDLNNSGGFGLTLNDGATKRLKFFQRNSDNSTSITAYTFQSNTWYFVAVTISNGTAVNLYLYNQSGTLLASKSGSHNNATSYDSGTASIGNEPSGSSEDRGFYGNIDEVSLYSGALTATEVETLSQSTHACPSLVTNTAASKFNCVVTSGDAAIGHLYTQRSGTSFSFDIVALNASNSVETGYAAASDQSVTVEFVDGSGSTACASRSALSPAISQTVTFSASDAGRKSASTMINKAYKNLRCRVTDSNSTTVTACSSDNFSVRPTSFTVTSTNATAGADFTNPWRNEYATPTFKAGTDSFNLTVSTNVVGYDGTPTIKTPTGYNNEDVYSWAHGASPLPTDSYSSNTYYRVVGAVTGSFGAANSTTGNATGNFSYSEAGYFRFQANSIVDTSFSAVDQANSDCTLDYSNSLVSSKYGCYIGHANRTNFFGRFVPAYFQISPVTTTPACSSNFTYYGQDGLSSTFTITAKNGAGTTTQNYTDNAASEGEDYGHLDLTSASNFNFTSSSDTIDSSTITSSGSWVRGEATVTAKHKISRPTTATAPTNITIYAQPTDSDGVTISSATATSSASEFRYGRLLVPNVYGSELSPLSMPIEAQYWNGTTYQRNQLDSCTTINPVNISMGNYNNNLAACETQLSGGGTMASGKTVVNLTKPGHGNNGSVDLTVNTNTSSGNTCIPTSTQATSTSYPWFGSPNPAARATFGLFKSPVIYMRESY